MILLGCGDRQSFSVQSANSLETQSLEGILEYVKSYTIPDSVENVDTLMEFLEKITKPKNVETDLEKPIIPNRFESIVPPN